MWSALIVWIRMAVLVYLGLVLVLAGFQRSMMYFPERRLEAEAVRLAALDGLEPWRDDGGEIIGWHSAGAGAEAGAMLLFHGNAGCAAQRSYFVQGFAPDLAVYLFEYPGYGARSGAPSEKRFAAAGAAALRQLRRERPGRIFLGGESLGAGVACRLAGAHPDWVAGVFLTTPFSSLAEVARSHYPFFPAGWLLRDRYESAAHLRTYAGPVTILLAGRDEVVPVRFGRKLYDTYAGPKQLWVQHDGTHNTLDYSRGGAWWREVVDFLAAHAARNERGGFN